jgi:hypothetical protein
MYLVDDKDIQRCPFCGVWGSKDVGCNSVVCGYNILITFRSFSKRAVIVKITGAGYAVTR